ncbi:MAG: hypothetical protein ABEK50_18975, partial [bacterium]
TDPAEVERPYAWINYYEPGIYIPKHTDGEGIFQVLIGLQQPDVPAPQGILEIGDTQFRLEPGDLLLFRATEVPHQTYPIENVDRARMTLTIRYCE